MKCVWIARLWAGKANLPSLSILLYSVCLTETGDFDLVVFLSLSEIQNTIWRNESVIVIFKACEEPGGFNRGSKYEEETHEFLSSVFFVK